MQTPAAFLLAISLASCFASPSIAQAQVEAPTALVSNRPATAAKPVALPWRDIRWPSLDYMRQAIPGGGALYTLKGLTGRKFRIDAVFEIGSFTLPREKRPLLGAAIDLLLLGGAGKRSFEQIQTYVLEHGVQIDTRLTNLGYLRVSVSGLSEDFDIGLEVLEDLLLRPRFDRDALEQWKQEQMDSFSALLDGSSSSKQARFMEQEVARLVFGPDHYYSQQLRRSSRRTTRAITNEDVMAVSKRLINRAGLTMLLSGSFTSEQQAKVHTLGTRLPRKDPEAFTWMPDRPKVEAPGAKVRATVIRKTDMAQCNVILRHYAVGVGRLNELERTQVALLREIFSSSGGVVGNDRFSRALRAESGLSYSPSASFDGEAMEPNTNVALWRLAFQSPNEKVGEAVAIARQTWKTFVAKGIAADELERARVSRMNMMMAQEPTIFDKADGLLEDLLARQVPSAIGLENNLLRLERETNVAAVNGTLTRLAREDGISALVIMGNPPADQLARLKDTGEIDIVKEVKFEDLVRELQDTK